MYVDLLQIYVEISQQSPLLYVGIMVLLLASWGLIITALVEIAVRLFDIDQP